MPQYIGAFDLNYFATFHDKAIRAGSNSTVAAGGIISTRFGVFQKFRFKNPVGGVHLRYD